MTMDHRIRIINAEFKARSQRNPRYSLRAFARSLGISHTILSLVLSGKRPLSRQTATRIAERLELPSAQAQAFITPSLRRTATNRDADYELIELETFSLISDWVHYALLSLLETRGAKDNPKWMARRLGISEDHVETCWQRLIHLDLIKKNNGRWKQTGKPIKIENQVSTEITRKFHRGLLEKAMDSLENDPVEVRDFSSMTFAMDPKHIPYAKQRIREFRRDLVAELEAKGNPKEVCNLTVQIYPVTRGEEK